MTPSPGPSTPVELARGRVTGLLSPIREGGVGLVIAPSGSGKSTLVRQWAAALEGPLLWLDPPWLPSATAFAQYLGGRPDVRGVVVEDVDRFPAAMTARLQQLIVNASHLPVVLTAQRPPAVNLAHREVLRPTVVTGADLAFRPWEVAALFVEVYEDPLSPQDVLELHARTQGWVGALRLWHLSRRLDPWNQHRDGMGADLPSLVAAYVERQFLDGLSPDHRDFLQSTSVLDVVTAQRADALLSRADSHVVLAGLAEQVGLVFPEPDGVGFRCHPVLRAHLRSGALRELGRRSWRAQQARAARTLEADGELVGAFLAWCRAGKTARAASLCGPLRSHELRLPPEALADLTAELAGRDPRLGLVRARLLLRDGSTYAAERAVDQALRAAASATTSRDPGEQGLQAEAAELQQQARALRGASTPARRGPSTPSGRLLENLAFGRLAQARQQVLETGVLRDGQDPAGLAARLAVATTTALVERAPVADAIDRAAVEAAATGHLWLERLAFGVVLASTQGWQRADAAALATERRRAGDPWSAALIEATIAVVDVRSGRPDVDLLDRLASAFRRLGSVGMEAWSRALLALAVSEEGLPDPVVVESAEAFARAAMAPAPLAIAVAARVSSTPTDAQDLTALAHRLAVESGLAVRPWTWRRDGSAPLQAEPTAASAVSGPGAVSIHCFEDFALCVDDRQVDLSPVRPVARTVLHILAVNAGTWTHRDVLLEALWPELGEASAKHNLHVAISSLRSCLDIALPGRARDLVARQAQAYMLGASTELVTDLQRFDAALAQATQAHYAGDRLAQIGALESALGLYRGEVLPADGTPEWLTGVRDRCRLRAAAAAVTLSELELARSSTSAAVAAATRATQIDPWSDASWRALITALDRAGQPAQAQRARAEYATLLASLGVRTVPPVDENPGYARVKNATSARATRLSRVAP